MHHRYGDVKWSRYWNIHCHSLKPFMVWPGYPSFLTGTMADKSFYDEALMPLKERLKGILIAGSAEVLTVPYPPPYPHSTSNHNDMLCYMLLNRTAYNLIKRILEVCKMKHE